MSHPNRRQFFRMISAWGLVASGSLRRNRAYGERPCDNAALDLPVVTRTSHALGSDISLTAWHADQEVATKAIEDAFGELRLVDRLMSLYRPDSQLCCLNRERVLEAPHPYMLEVLHHAAAMSQRSQGAFDVTVQPLWRLYADCQLEGVLPKADLVERVRKHLNWRSVDLSLKHIRLQGTGVAITLNGIAQGFAADRVAAAFRASGVRHALINTGEVRALGEKPDNGRWNVGIQHPRREDAYISIAGLAGRSLATSGDYATTFSTDYRHHHLFDPQSGYSPRQLSSVSIAAPTATQADALSTAVFVLGPDLGLKLVRSYSGTDAFLVRKDGTILVTDGFPTVRM